VSEMREPINSVEVIHNQRYHNVSQLTDTPRELILASVTEYIIG